jgi:hypothetical protein
MSVAGAPKTWAGKTWAVKTWAVKDLAGAASLLGVMGQVVGSGTGSIGLLLPPRRHPCRGRPTTGGCFFSLIGAIVPICVAHRPIDSTHDAGRGDRFVLPLATERACQMFTAQQYRAKAAEFRSFLANTPRSPNETSEFRDLEQTYTTLAENEEWMAIHLDKTIQRRKKSDDRTALAEEEEQILKCLGAAVLMRWNTIPTKLQRELFDCASTIGDLQPTTSLKGQIARFLHNHKDDQQESDEETRRAGV